MNSSFRIWAAVTGTAAIATAGFLVPATAGATSIHPASDTALTSTAALSTDKYTELSMTFVNNTNLPLTLVNSGHPSSGAHWEARPPQTLAPGATGTASAYSSLGTEIELIYQAVAGGNSTAFTLQGEVPFAGGNSASGSATGSGYEVLTSHSTGKHATASYTIQPGSTFNYTGASTTYVVPYGVTKLQLEAVGGGSNAAGYGLGPTYGADITGTLPVTPGETLLIAPAGSGGGTSTSPSSIDSKGGWGVTYNGDSYSGGSTVIVDSGAKLAQPGGGATVVIDEGTGQILAVAGGAGGSGDSSGTSGACVNASYGGNAGADGSWTGANGQPAAGGGAAGGGSTPTGQSSTATDYCAGGAGGGGVKGGLAGADGGGYGGGAGSSSAPGVTSATITTANQNGKPQNGWVVLSPAN
jgi:hypothetical protein